MNRANKFKAFILFLAVAATIACGSGPIKPAAESANSPDAKEEEKAEPSQTQAPSDSVVKLDERTLTNITTLKVVEENVPMILTATGKVQFNADQMARIVAPVSGQAMNLTVKVGDPVQKGETLFLIHSREAVAALTDLLESHKDKDLAEKTYTMTKDLYDHQAASRIALQQAETDLAKATAMVARNEEAIHVLGLELKGDVDFTKMDSRIPITAPLSGTVIERPVTDGQFVQPDPNPLITIADMSSVWVLADIFEQDLGRIKMNQRAEVTTAAYPNDRFVAHVSRISDVVDPATRTVKVRFLVFNPGGRLKPEMFANVTLFLAESEKGLLIPADAVFVQHGKGYSYVRSGPREFSKRSLEVLPDGTGKLRVVRGLKPGEEIVTDGAMLLTQEND